MEFRHRAGEGTGEGPPGGAGDHQTLRGPETVSWQACGKEREPRLVARARASARSVPSSTSQPPHSAGTRGPQALPARRLLPPTPGSPSPTLPRPQGYAPRLLHSTRRRGPVGPAVAARGSWARRKRRIPSFSPSLLAQAQPGRTGPLALCLLLLLHGAIRLGGGSLEKRAREQARRAGGAGRGGARKAGGADGGGSGRRRQEELEVFR